MRSGLFITVEGPDGSGKTAQLKALVSKLEGLDLPVLATREPGGTSISDQIRGTLLDLKNTAMIDLTEALLYQAARAQLVEELIKPHLQQGGIVICDRYADSTLAYQGYGHQNSLDDLQSIINYATGGLKPDRTLLLDLDPEIGLQRRINGGNFNRLDAYDLSFHKRVRDGYCQLASEEPDRWIIVDASQSFDEVQKELWDTLILILKQADFVS
jgi:dTMP kinase